MTVLLPELTRPPFGANAILTRFTVSVYFAVKESLVDAPATRNVTFLLPAFHVI